MGLNTKAQVGRSRSMLGLREYSRDTSFYITFTIFIQTRKEGQRTAQSQYGGALASMEGRCTEALL